MSHIFISYTNHDIDFAENLIVRIQQEGFKVWVDNDSLLAGYDWRGAIDDAIKNAFALIVIMTPEAKSSELVTYEWAFALGAGVNVIPVLLENTILHPRMEALQYLDFAYRVERRPWSHLIDILKIAQKRKDADIVDPKLLASSPSSQNSIVVDNVDFFDKERKFTSKEFSNAQLEIFMSYAHQDEKWRREIEKQLSNLQNQGKIKGWHDRQINAGVEWEKEIIKHLETAQIILLLISPNFMASTFIYSKELKRAIERHKAGEVRVIPILLRPVDWKGAPFEKLQMLPVDAKPIISSRWRSSYEALYNVAQGIRKVVEELNGDQ